MILVSEIQLWLSKHTTQPLKLLAHCEGGLWSSLEQWSGSERADMVFIYLAEFAFLNWKTTLLKECSDLENLCRHKQRAPCHRRVRRPTFDKISLHLCSPRGVKRGLPKTLLSPHDGWGRAPQDRGCWLGVTILALHKRGMEE